MRGFSSITIMCIVFCFKWSTQEKVTIRIPEADVKALRETAVICEKETGVPAAFLKQIITWTVSNDESTKKFLYCICYNTGYVDKDGHAIVKKIGALPVVNASQEDYVKKLEECNQITLENHIDTLFGLADCVLSTYAYST